MAAFEQLLVLFVASLIRLINFSLCVWIEFIPVSWYLRLFARFLTMNENMQTGKSQRVCFPIPILTEVIWVHAVVRLAHRCRPQATCILTCPVIRSAPLKFKLTNQRTTKGQTVFSYVMTKNSLSSSTFAVSVEGYIIVSGTVLSTVFSPANQG